MNTPVRFYASLSVALWTVLVLGSMTWSLQGFNEQAVTMATAQAHLTWNEDQAVRDWANQYDGVHVATRTDQSPAPGTNQSPGMAPSDKLRFSPITVSQMTREVQQKFTDRFPGTEKITMQILTLKDPEADPWQRRALQSLAAGSTKMVKQTSQDGHPDLRMMMAIYGPKNCPKCPNTLDPPAIPAPDGGTPNALRGGVSITIPLTPYFQAMQPLRNVALAAHGGLWIIGLGVMGGLAKRGQQRNLERASYCAQLTNSENKYRQLIENAPEIVYSVSDQSGGLYWSHRVQDILGYSPQHMLDHPTLWRDSIHNDDRPAVDDAIARAVPGEGFETNYRIRDAAGTWRYFHDRNVVHLSDQGARIHDGLASDITARTQAERALADSEKKFASIHKSQSLTAIISIDDLGLVSMWNPGAEKAFGYLEREIIGQPLASLMPKRFRDAHNAGLHQARESGLQHFVSRTVELSGLHKDGHEFPIELSLGAWSSAGKTYFSGIINDITERKAYQARLQKAKEDAEKATEAAELANQTKTQFLANMSHELRTPLNAIIGFSEIMSIQMVGPLSQTYQRYASDICSSGQLLLGLIADILDTAKIESGNMKLHETDIDMRGLAETCMILIHQKSKAANVTIEIDFPQDLPMLFADEIRVKQILLNIVSNAIKFNKPHGRVCLHARLTHAKGLEILVTDTGRGINEKDLITILEPFKQVEDIMSRSHEGSGLGLPLSKNLAELHGGTLSIHSKPDQGTTVTVFFPPERVHFSNL